MQSQDLRLIYVTCPSVASADEIGAALVEERLTACVNILPGMRSIYRWQGAVERAEEVVLLAKTTSAAVDQVACQGAGGASLR